jgi:transcriptional regulator with XRE-family HTH domain
LKVKLKSANRLDEMLIRHGFSRRAFSKKAGIGEATIIQIFNGSRNPSPRTAKLIVEALGLQFDEVFAIIKEANASTNGFRGGA